MISHELKTPLTTIKEARIFSLKGGWIDHGKTGRLLTIIATRASG